MTEPDPRRRRRAQGALETQVLAALHEARGPVTAGWVQEHLAAELAYTTVMTVLARLLAKNAVTRKREGRSFVWMPAADEAGLAALKMHRVLDGEQDRRAVLASFITTLPEDDEQLLRELLDQADDED
ncbi:BlaI/MecI/CopY family transcriptional regulator [Streptomyces gibsoniae]|uniref:BlaI/MecI/CopY family transcriptional regulator n=1 Tax=Streptomyces gibsoniae TaxID=3075529 RepID=A0ABU2TVE1_9ACTN|nr:BlaI/MecI/CopY family transcriptional regulator [Streptomyces sp. DSM 41699]MDT0464943.1 BlaI/MecI/CopY family transcriptional regulator [Streptomyces sp. DSM 41699]